MASLVLDNGGYTAKVGFATDKNARVVPNSVIKAKTVRNRIFIADQIEDCKDLSGLYYLLPFQKGYLVNWEIQRQVWDYLFSKDCLKVDFASTGVVVTEPYFNFSSIQEGMNEIFFEEYNFKSILRCNPGHLAQYKRTKETGGKYQCCLVVDSGYSFTHIVPYHNGKKVKEGLKRMNVGGKILTNHLKEVISYRQLMVMDETYVINQVKEDTCFVSTDFNKDIEIARRKGPDNTIVRDYVLPDYTQVKRGYIRPVDEMWQKHKGTEQVIRLNNERFCSPEVLFHPSDIGIQEMGIPEAIVYAVSALPEEMQPHMYLNIVLTGGNAMLPGYKERLYNELRSLVPAEYEINVHLPENPVTYNWEGGKALTTDPSYKSMCVTKQDYYEHGQAICTEKFDI